VEQKDRVAIATWSQGQRTALEHEARVNNKDTCDGQLGLSGSDGSMCKDIRLPDLWRTLKVSFR